MRPFSANDCPSTRRSPPNSRFHNPSVSTTTLAAPGLSSSGVRPRPSAGWTPNVAKKLAVTRAAGNCTGPASTVMLARVVRTAATDWNEPFSLARSR